MKFAAIDIGSNAIRMQISAVHEFRKNLTFKRVEYIRFPLRLGKDVFASGKLSEESQLKFIKLMEAFRLLIELYEVDGHMACATSAMRNSENGEMLAQLVEEKLGLKIHIIDGEREAEMIADSLAQHLPEGHSLHIDVGGGSTELNYYENKEKKASSSFNLGSVRLLQGVADHASWETMRSWIKKNFPKGHAPITAVGTGGNISKLFSYANKRPGKTVSLQKLKNIRDWIEEHSLEERMHLLNMNPDRADVILPASEIYLKVMEWSGAKKILVPDLGLKDGIIQQLYQKHETEKAGR